MISVKNGGSFVMRNPNSYQTTEELIVEISRLVRAASPFIESIEIFNKTKSCSVDIAFSDKKVQVIFRNPKDTEFDLNELENPVTPLTMSGR